MKKLALYKCFNPRTHTGCDSAPNTLVYGFNGFNPRTHTGCDDLLFRYGVLVLVSIHAPTRGATDFPVFTYSSIPVSIHAPTRGATHTTGDYTTISECFNPRTHTGCDSNNSYSVGYSSSFNPRTHTGCDMMRTVVTEER